MRIGVLGGSFDPPHAAHAAIAGAARDRLVLDRVLWVPALEPPHKAVPATPFPDRLAMTRVLAAGVPASQVSDVEARLPRPSYTVRTLAALREEHGPGHEWFLILGADNWEGFPSWRDPVGVLSAASVVVYPRNGHAVKNLPAGGTLLEVPELPENSTDYRAWFARDREAALAALPRPVADCIRARGLYPPEPAA